MEGSTPLSVDDPSRQEVDDVVVRFAGDSGMAFRLQVVNLPLRPRWPETIFLLFPTFPRK